MGIGFQSLKKKLNFFIKKDFGVLKKVLYLHPQYKRIEVL
jgi:hypothetical protein